LKVSQDTADTTNTAPQPEPWEWWTLLSVSLLGLLLITYAIAFLRLGTISLYAHGLGIPAMGVLTVPLMFMGLLRTIFRPPAIRRSRTIAFVALIIVGFLGNTPLFPAPTSTADWKSTHSYRLPMDGEWVTLAGGSDMDTNYHSTTAAYRWGYDFGKVQDGKKFKLDGGRAEDYFAFGQPVLAPVEGKIKAVETGLSDNVPGQYESAALGNFIMIEVEPDEYLFLAHLKSDSVTVRLGEVVKKGQVIAAVGNSGRTLEPHLHVHLQNTAEFPFSESLPLRFSNYSANGKHVDLGMPLGSLIWDAPEGERVAQEPVQ